MDEQSRIQLLRWWQSMMLSPNQLKDKGIVPAPTAFKAQLKRCESADTAMLSTGFRALWLKLPDEITGSSEPSIIECWATIAAVLVHVKPQNGTESKIKLAVAAGKKTDGDKSVVSELRFSQLQNAKTADDFLRRARRIVQQVKGEVAVLGLAIDIQRWFAEQNELLPRKASKRIGVEWAMDYYRAASSKAK